MDPNETIVRIAPRHGVAAALGRAVATLAVLAALTLWCAAESVHPAGGWIAQPADDTIVLAMAVFVLLAASVSGWTGLAFSALAGGALVCLSIDATFTTRALAAVSIGALCYALWQRRPAIAGHAPWRLLLGTATIPAGVWVAIRLDATVYAATLGAVLTAYVLYAFARGSAGRRGRVRIRGIAGVLARLPEQFAAVSALLAVAGFGLLARAL